MTVHSSVTLPQLARRFSEAIEDGAGIALSAEEFSVFEATGAYGLLLEALEHQRSPYDFPNLARRCEHCQSQRGHRIYFIRAKSGGPVKIGFTTKPKDRLVALQTGAPEDLVFIALFSGAQSDEGVLHNFYEREWIRGEWFRASPRLLAYAEHRGVIA